MRGTFLALNMGKFSQDKASRSLCSILVYFLEYDFLLINRLISCRMLYITYDERRKK